MSVLYPLTLRRNCTHSQKNNAAFRLLIFFLIAALSFQSSFGQDEKAIQKRKDAELQKQEAAQLESKLKANPKYTQRLQQVNKSNPQDAQLTEEQEKKIAMKSTTDEAAKRALEKKIDVVFQGVDYKVVTSGNNVEYVVTSAGVVIFRQPVNAAGNLYARQVQAEKEAIYASNILRRNINYPLNALQSEIRALTAAPRSYTISGNRENNSQRITADYVFNGGSGTINASGVASPYPSVITVSGVPAGAIVKEIKINGLNHTYASDVDILLQSPSGTNVFLMSDVGSFDNFVNNNYTFNDAAAANMSTALPASGSWKPTNLVGTLGPEPDNFPAPGPGAVAQANPTLSSFGNGNQNGDWKLFVFDDFTGDAGNWASWSITFTDPPAICFPINITSHPSNTSICTSASGSFNVTATPNGVTYNWQVNTGSGFTYITNGGVYSGANTASLTITNPTASMSGYQYRVVVTCSQGGLPEISNPATLTVFTAPGSPVISPSAASICPGGSVALNFVPNAVMQISSGTITIPSATASPASPYPSTLSVSGIPAGSIVKQVILTNLSHTWPSDLDIVLQSPTGTNVILLSDRGGSTDAVNATLTFDDAAAALVSNTAIVSGTFRPTNTAGPDAWPAPGPSSFTQVNPTLATFAGNLNGTWNLFVNDQAGGDGGSIIGWSIVFETPPGGPTSAVFSPQAGLFTDAGLTTPYTGTPVTTVYASPATTTVYSATVSDGTCNSAPTNIPVSINQVPAISAQPANGSACIGTVKTFSVTATGTGLTYQWQVDNGTGFVNITGGTPTNPGGFIYTGQTSATLSINTLMTTMNGYKYRVVVSGTCTPAVTSSDVTLTINARPAISITSSSTCAPTTLTASGASTYSWSPSTGLSATTGASVTANPTVNTIYTVTGTSAAGCVNTSQVDVKFTPPIPVIAPTAPIICAGAVQQLSVTSSSLPPVAGTTSSGTVNLPFADGPPLTVAISNLNVTGITGAVQSISVNLNIAHTYDGDVTINLKAPNGNIYNLAWEVGGSGDNFTNTTFSSLGGTPIFSGSAPFTGTFAADGFNGVGIAPNLSNVTSWSSLFSVPNGTWSLICSDPWDLDDGTLISWSITINYAVPDAAVWTPATGLFTDAAATTAYVAGTPASTVYASPASTTTYSATVTNSSIETKTFSTGGAVTIPGVAPGSTASGAGAPYPSTVSVSGLPANAIVKSVVLRRLRHSWSSDMDILLKSPTGTNVVLMSDVGGSAILNYVTYTFDDAGGAMSTTSGNGTGTYRPTNSGASDTYPAPIGTISQASPALSLFTGDPNGTWNLYINDGASGDIGTLTSWEITFTIPTATNCISAPRTVTVTVQQPISFTTQPLNRTVCQNSNVTFTAAATGTITSTQWQVSTNGGGAGGNWTNIAGATTTTLTLNNVQPSQSGYKYRLVLGNTGCGNVNSAEATLTVNPKPTVSLSVTPAGQTQLKPGMLTTLTVNSNPAGTSYQWFVNGVAQPGITGSSYTVDAYHLGTYTVRVTTAAGCDSITTGVTFTAIPTTQLFVYPNPTTGAYYVTYYMRNPVPVTINVIDMKGRRVVQRQETTTGPYTRFDFTNDKLAAGVYVIEFRDPSENLLATGRLVVLR